MSLKDSISQAVRIRAGSAAKNLSDAINGKTSPSTAPGDGPRFAHDCEDCIFLGRFDDCVEGPTDLYYHKAGEPLQTLIARYGSDPAAYTSGIEFVNKIDSISEAFRRAKERNLL